MQIKLASVMVAGQAHALRFCTDGPGFKKMADLPMGTFRCLPPT